ncbi:uncharacterized protein LOC144442840 [Glandiceps talaboti]
MATVNKCCSSCCGCLTLCVGLVYFILIVGLMAYCYGPFLEVDTSTALICEGMDSLSQFVDMVTLVYIILLCTTGCLGFAAAKSKSDTIVALLMVSALVTFLLSNLMIAEKIILLSAIGNAGGSNSTDTGFAALSKIFGQSFADPISSIGSPLVVNTLFLLCALAGFVFGLVCTCIACCGVCRSNSKVGPIDKKKPRDEHEMYPNY